MIECLFSYLPTLEAQHPVNCTESQALPSFLKYLGTHLPSQLHCGSWFLISGS
jgi:hypothetical protein